MSEYTPSVEEGRNAWIEYQTEVPSDGAYLPMSVEDAGAQWDRMIAEVERAAAEKAWMEGHAAGRDYQGDGWNSDAHDPAEDNPYRREETPDAG